MYMFMTWKNKKIPFMITEDKIKDIILTMIENKMLDSTRIFDKEYVLERVNSYIKSANMVRSMMNMPLL